MARKFQNKNRSRFREPLHRTNERIRVPAVRVISEDGEQLGVMDVRDAIQRARAAGVDLVEVAPNAQPPVCRMIDYGKFLYEEKKRAAEAKKKQVTVSVKEIKFRPGTDEHDYSYRMKHAREWLEGGDKVRAAIAFRGREMTHRELGAKILKKLTEDLTDLAEVEISPKMEGYQMFTIFVPKKAKVSKAKAAASIEKAAKKETADEPAVEKAAKKEPAGEPATAGEPASAGEPALAITEAANDQVEG